MTAFGGWLRVSFCMVPAGTPSCDCNVLARQGVIDRDGEITAHLSPVLMPIGPSSKLKGQIAGQTNVRPPREPDMLAAAYLDCSIRSVKTRRHCRRVNLTPVLFSTHATTSLRVGARPRLSRNC